MFINEKSLVEGLVNSDDRAFDYILDEYGDDILRFCYMKVNDESIAEDLTQETFINIFKYIGRFKGKSSLKTWIYKIALNCCREYFRKNKNLVIVDDSRFVQNNIIAEFDLEEEILTLVDNEIIASALEEIKPQYKDIIYMFYYKDFTVRDIAEILEQNENTIKTKLRRGRNELGKVLAKEGIYGQA